MIDRTQPEYRAIEKLLSPRLQEMLDRAFDNFNKKWERDADSEKLWGNILSELPISHYEAKLLDIANSIWGGGEIRIPLIEFHGFDRENKKRILVALATYMDVSHLIGGDER